MARYTVLRMLVFLGALIVCYLVGLRDFALVAVAALASGVLSFFLLRLPREEMTQQVVQRVDRRRARRASASAADQAAEDAEASGS
jgi:hypothetical protein